MGSVARLRGKVETVQQKGLRLFLGGRVKHLGGGRYSVRGDSGTYEFGHDQACPCEARVYCSHKAGAEIAQARLNTRTAERLEAARERARVRKGSGLDSGQILANLAIFPLDAA